MTLVSARRSKTASTEACPTSSRRAPLSMDPARSGPEIDTPFIHEAIAGSRRSPCVSPAAPQPHAERGAHTHLALERYAAAVRFDHGLDQREPQP